MPRATKSRPARSVTFEEFTEVTLQAVTRALQARRLPHGPIIIGIIWAPALGELAKPQTPTKQ